MRKIELIIVGLLFVAFIISCKTNTNRKDRNSQMQIKQKDINESFVSRLVWTDTKIEDENYTIWGSSPIIGDDGRVHVFVARWPEKNVDPGWRKSSEIAHYIADTPEGEYVFSDVAVKGTGIQGNWNRYAPHNPEIKKIGDYYAIVYVANSDYHVPPHPANQRIGLVYSKSLYGPWKDAGKDGMILEPSRDKSHWTYGSALGVDNPCIMEIDDKPVVYFKNRIDENGTIKAKYGYATAQNIEGPYTMSDQPITDNESYLEDATTFIWKGKFHLLTTDNFGTVTGVKGGGILWSSDDWKKFNLSNTALAYYTIPTYFKEYDKNNVNKIYGGPKFERPKVLMINGEPAYFFAPSGWNVEGEERNVCYILKIGE